MSSEVQVSDGPAIRVAGLSKRYLLGEELVTYGRLTESLVSTLRHPFRAKPKREELWALSEVNLEVAPGEILGVIGRNGSGKTTLLKVLSRITKPTRGEALLRGRVGSLLEVGTGFHPELSGMDNIFLSGAILGMTKAEVRSKFDAIVEFAELERFTDTPVKRYSSGMYVRLAFAVAAHLDPDILLVDEVLAVGDASFQKRSLGKLGDIAGQGRTVLFVSHNLAAVRSLCTRAILLERGRLVRQGTPDEVIGQYLESAEAAGSFSDLRVAHRLGSGTGRIVDIGVEGSDAGDHLRVKTGGPLRVSITFAAGQAERFVEAGFMIKDRYERYLVDLRSTHAGQSVTLDEGVTYRFYMEVDSLPLYPGEYTVGVFVAKTNGAPIDYIPEAGTLLVEDDGSLMEEGKFDARFGQFFVPSRWELSS